MLIDHIPKLQSNEIVYFLFIFKTDKCKMKHLKDHNKERCEKWHSNLVKHNNNNKKWCWWLLYIYNINRYVTCVCVQSFFCLQERLTRDLFFWVELVHIPSSLFWNLVFFNCRIFFIFQERRRNPLYYTYSDTPCIHVNKARENKQRREKWGDPNSVNEEKKNKRIFFLKSFY